jgi:hypothetical protein
MALDKSSLEADLKAIFQTMRQAVKTNAWMAEQIADAIKEYILAGTVSTADTGAAPAGAYAGQGTGTMTISDSDLEADLTPTFENTEVNSFLAEHMATDIDAACTEEDISGTVTSGTVTTPVGATSPMAGTGKGTFSGEKATIQALLTVCFETMNAMTEDGDDYLAAQIALAIDNYLKAGNIDVTLQAPLTGSGNGGIS